MWCNEPLENLTRWGYCDTLEFSRRGRGWMNWTFEQSAEFEEWRKDRERQYKKLELEVSFLPSAEEVQISLMHVKML